MSYPGESSVDGRVRAVEKEYAARQTRMFVLFALIEGIVLLVGVGLVYGLEVVDPELGVLLLLGVAVIGGSALSMLLMRHMQARHRAVAQARGENPLF